MATLDKEIKIIMLKGASGQDGQDGQDGTDGQDGKSSYELAIENELFSGTLAEWINTFATPENYITRGEFQKVTQAQYDALKQAGELIPNCYYLIIDDTTYEDLISAIDEISDNLEALQLNETGSSDFARIINNGNKIELDISFDDNGEVNTSTITLTPDEIKIISGQEVGQAGRYGIKINKDGIYIQEYQEQSLGNETELIQVLFDAQYDIDILKNKHLYKHDIEIYSTGNYQVVFTLYTNSSLSINTIAEITPYIPDRINAGGYVLDTYNQITNTCNVTSVYSMGANELNASYIRYNNTYGRWEAFNETLNGTISDRVTQVY